MEDRNRNGRKFRFLNVLDEHTHERLASVPRRSWRNNAVIELLSDLMLIRGVPEYMRSDNGSEFAAKEIRKLLTDAGSITAFIEPSRPWENGYIERFNARMRVEFRNNELFDTIYEAQVLTQRWVRYYNQIRSYSSLGGRPPLKPWFQSLPRISR